MTSPLLQLRNDLMLHVDAKAEPTSTALSSIQSALKALGDNVTRFGQRVPVLNEDGIADNFGRVKQLEKVHTYLTLDHLWRTGVGPQNLRVVSIPEPVEGSDATGIVAGLIPKVLGPAYFPQPAGH